jgi:drug/metabolite transporter (DMT)-like permease
MSPAAFLVGAFIFTITNRLFTKYLLNKADSYATAVLTNILCSLALLPFVWTELPRMFELPPIQLVLLVFLGLVWAYISWVGNVSIAQNNFSFKEVIRQTRILWVVLGGVLLLGEALSVTDFIGIACIIASVLIISYREFSFKEHVSSVPILLAWSVSLASAVVALTEKVLLNFQSLSIAGYAFVLYVVPLPFLLVFLNRERVRALSETAQGYSRDLLIVTGTMLASYLFALAAYQAYPIAIAYPIVQSSTVLGVVIGTMLFEGGVGWQKKLVATLVAVAGVVLIQLW